VRNLLRGCTKHREFALYLEVDGGLTDVGLDYIGQNSPGYFLAKSVAVMQGS